MVRQIAPSRHQAIYNELSFIAKSRVIQVAPQLSVDPALCPPPPHKTGYEEGSAFRLSRGGRWSDAHQQSNDSDNGDDNEAGQMCSPRTGRAIAFPMCAFDTLPSVPSSLREPSQPLPFILVNHVVSIVCNRPSVIGSKPGLTWAAPRPSLAASAHSGCRGCRSPWPWPSPRPEGRRAGACSARRLSARSQSAWA